MSEYTPPALTLARSGHTVHIRRLSPEIVTRLNDAAAQELAAEKPAEPAEGEQPSEELKAWQKRVRELSGLKLARIIQSYAVLNETDAAAVAAYREALAAVGAESADDDRAIYVWQVLAPTPADQQQLFAFVLGAPATAAKAS